VLEKENISIYRFQQQQKLHETQAETQCRLELNDRVTIVTYTNTDNTFTVWICRCLSLYRHHACMRGQPGSLYTAIVSNPGQNIYKASKQVTDKQALLRLGCSALRQAGK
jgi:hypothetical protein